MTAAAALVAGGSLIAQMEAGDRGILPIDSSGTLEIGGIHVDVGGKTGAEARFAGWREAQRQGFKAMWAKSHGRPIGEAPTLSDSVLDGLVSSIIIEREQIGPNRYIADLGILFDRARAGEILGIGGQTQRSAPMLIIPIVTSAGSPVAVEHRNPWQRAWAQFRTSQSPIDYVRVSGLGVDPLLVNAAQTRRPGRAWWRNILDLYGAANVLVAQVDVQRLYPGGPARARFIGSFGPDRKLLGTFDLTAKDSADMPRMMAEGVRRMDEMFSQALAAGIVRGDPSLIIQPPPPPPVEDKPVETPSGAPTAIQIQIDSPDPASLQAGIGYIRNTPGVDAVTERSLAFGGSTTLFVTYRGDIGALRSALLARNWNVEQAGSGLRISRRATTAPPAVAPDQPPSP